MNETKRRILNSAERLIAERGLDVSLRTITAEAGVNLAAINYHFQSKDTLIDEVIARRIEPINQSRLQMLDELERDYPSGRLPLEGILQAFIAPVIEMKAGQDVRILFGRLYSLPDEFLNRLFTRHLHPIFVRFSAAFARAVPEMPLADRLWCLNFTVGSMVHVMTWSRRISAITDGALDIEDTKALTARMVEFAAAGFRAASERTGSSQGNQHA